MTVSALIKLSLSYPPFGFGCELTYTVGTLKQSKHKNESYVKSPPLSRYSDIVLASCLTKMCQVTKITSIM